VNVAGILGHVEAVDIWTWGRGPDHMRLVYRGRVCLAKPDGPLALIPADPEGAQELWGVLHSTWSDRMLPRGWLAYTAQRCSSTMAAEVVHPKAAMPPLLTPEDKERWLAVLRAHYGEAWVRDNWRRLEEEWAYIQGL
jgi:hypothetical protein